MDIIEKIKYLSTLAETNQPLAPHCSVELKTFPEDKKQEIEQIIKKNAARRSELIEKDGCRPHLDVSGYKLDIDISSTPSCDIVFDSHTDFSRAILPSDFNPGHIMESGKDAGQNIRQLHKAGITGKGINIAIIDEALSDHKEYHDKIKHYEAYHDFPTGSFHGTGVASLAVGTNCGVAPEAKVYFFAVWSNSNFKYGTRTVGQIPEAIQRCIEINRLLPEGEKIAAISISQACDPTMVDFDKYEEMRLAAEKEGIDVITVKLFKEKGLSFDGYNRDLNKDVNDSCNILPLVTKYIDSRVTPEWFSDDKNKKLLFPVEHRTVALNTGNDDYAHFAMGGYSWIIPQITGLYALCKQANPNCTLDHMWELGLKTGFKCDNLDGIAVQPLKLVKELQKEKILENKRTYQEKQNDAQKHSAIYTNIAQKNR
ncbi:MAG: S8 family serine peptidase [Acetobacter sp.]|nr:S8 family serine peptidase [Acetobacter sp.]